LVTGLPVNSERLPDAPVRAAAGRSDQLAWQTLRGIWTHCQDEDGLGVRLTAAVIEERLTEYELSRVQLVGNPTVVQSVDAVLASWKTSVERDLLKPAIAWAESGQLSATLRSNDTLWGSKTGHS